MNRKTHQQGPTFRRGMTLIETFLAISITAMVGGAITTMMAAVTDEVTASQDTRSGLIRAGMAQSRLSSYIARSHCALEVSDTTITLWLEDSRDSGSVHASEVRWIRLDPVTGLLEAHFVCFPDHWSESARLLADTEYQNVESVDWTNVLVSFENKGLTCNLPLVEGVVDLEINGNSDDSLDITLVETTLKIKVVNDTRHTCTAESIRVHRRPGEEY